MIENKKVARRGGSVAGSARKVTEKELGKSVISRDNHLLLEKSEQSNKTASEAKKSTRKLSED